MSYRHLTQEERYQIAALLSAGLSNVAIARQLGRHPSTIGRERRRNTGERTYRAASAHKAAQTRRHHASSRPQLPAEAFAQIKHGVSQQLSPVQIRGRCQLLGMAVPSHTTIYRYIHRHSLRHRLRLPKRRRGVAAHRSEGRAQEHVRQAQSLAKLLRPRPRCHDKARPPDCPLASAGLLHRRRRDPNHPPRAGAS